jgi:hypothetical protein
MGSLACFPTAAKFLRSFRLTSRSLALSPPKLVIRALHLASPSTAAWMPQVPDHTPNSSYQQQPSPRLDNNAPSPGTSMRVHGGYACKRCLGGKSHKFPRNCIMPHAPLPHHGRSFCKCEGAGNVLGMRQGCKSTCRCGTSASAESGVDTDVSVSHPALFSGRKGLRGRPEWPCHSLPCPCHKHDDALANFKHDVLLA